MARDINSSVVLGTNRSTIGPFGCIEPSFAPRFPVSTLSIALDLVFILLDESPTSANLKNDHEFIINKKYNFETFWEKPKQSHVFPKMAI